MCRSGWTGLLLACLASLSLDTAAQELEARRYVNAPVGTNFLAVGYGYATGNVLLDPSLPVEGLDANLHIIFARYVRSVGVAGKSARIFASAPATLGDWDATLDNDLQFRRIDGFGDLAVGFDLNLLGAPAMSAAEFADYEPRTVAGVGLQVRVPVGQYESDRLLNLGSNRWTFIPQAGVSHTMGRWSFEAVARTWFFTTNQDFFGGNLLEQRPLGVVQLHGVYAVRPGFWVAVGAGLVNGGRTYLNGEARETLQQNSRLGIVVAYPLSARQGLRFTAGVSLTTSNGTDSRTLGLAFQHAWGGSH
jgi:hypothetical protein